MFLIDSSQYKVKDTKNKGRGVFAKTVIEPGVVIGDYLGKIVATDEAVRAEQFGTYHMEVTDYYSILADRDKEGIHFINHSCTPNCGTIDYEGRALFVSIRKIHIGEEITVNYYFGPPNKETCSPCVHTCYCGSQFCKGMMHSTVAKDDANSEDYLIKREEFTEELKKRFGKDLPPLSKYPDSVKDDAFFDLFGYEKLSPLVLQNSQIPSIKELREMIRNSGLTVSFPKLGFLVHGVMGDSFISTLIKKD